MEAKKKGGRVRRGKGPRAPSQRASSGAGIDGAGHVPSGDTAVAALPEYLLSDGSDQEDFWGFPTQAAVMDLSGQYGYAYSMNPEAAKLFSEEEEEAESGGQEFEGFTIHEV